MQEEGRRILAKTKATSEREGNRRQARSVGTLWCSLNGPGKATPVASTRREISQINIYATTNGQEKLASIGIVFGFRFAVWRIHTLMSQRHKHITFLCMGLRKWPVMCTDIASFPLYLHSRSNTCAASITSTQSPSAPRQPLGLRRQVAERWHIVDTLLQYQCQEARET